MSNERLMSIQELATATKLSKWFLYRATSRGMPYFRAGKALRFRLSEIEAWMKAQVGERPVIEERQINPQSNLPSGGQAK